MAVVLTMGTFDLFHAGHVELLKQCRKIAGPEGSVIASVNASNFVEEFKGRAPSQTTEERLTLVSACRYVDNTFVLRGQDAKPSIKSIKPDFIVIGSDWAGRNYHEQLMVDYKFLSDVGTSILYLDRWSPHSSTELKERIRGNS